MLQKAPRQAQGRLTEAKLQIRHRTDLVISFEVANLQNLNEIKQLTLKAHLLCNMKTLHPGAVPKTIGHSRCSSR